MAEQKSTLDHHRILLELNGPVHNVVGADWR